MGLINRQKKSCSANKKSLQEGAENLLEKEIILKEDLEIILGQRLQYAPALSNNILKPLPETTTILRKTLLARLSPN